MKRNNFIHYLLSIIVVLFCFTAVIWGQTNDKSLQNKTVNVVGENTTFRYILSVLRVNNVLIGFEKSNADKNEYKITIHEKNSKLEDVLDLLVKFEPIYKWEITDGVVNITPKVERDKFLESLLETKIKKFESSKGMLVYEFRDSLAKIPEIISLAESNKLSYDKYGAASRHLIEEINYKFDESEIKLKTLLNKILKETNANIWIVNRDKRFYRIRF